jgi:dihydropteroate synthase
MGVVNVTPDSFYDGGDFFDQDRAVRHGLELADEGADVIDVGGESSRPGAAPVPESEELRRVLPVIEALAPRVRVSVDTSKPAVAHAALGAGATMLNDISARMWELAAEHGSAWVAMHMQGSPATMQDSPQYRNVTDEVRCFLVERARRAREAGVEEVWVDPGIGFGKTVDHNLTLLRELPALVREGFPVVVGTSRKSFLGKIAPHRDGGVAPPSDRLEASVATATWAMLAGASMVRVHDVAPTVQAATLVGPARLGREGPRRARTGEKGAVHDGKVATGGHEGPNVRGRR